MGLLDKLKNKLGSVTAPGTSAVPGRLYAPLAGTLVPIEEIPDDVISQGILGQGCGIQPDNGKVFSPVDGVVSGIAQTLHAVHGLYQPLPAESDPVWRRNKGKGQVFLCGVGQLLTDSLVSNNVAHPWAFMELQTENDF